MSLASALWINRSSITWNLHASILFAMNSAWSHSAAKGGPEEPDFIASLAIELIQTRESEG
jgi:hypothetical protein